ncbi:MAG: cobyric acid synthase [Chloroflexi bacterium]|nr:cobyric acid synthase [Chloroflexota bacterium]
MPSKVLMVQGTASSAGKSTLVAALCRIFKQDGWRVAPFKAQNMSNNSYVTVGGGEMGRAQVAQAQAAGVEPHVDMNPILLKPEADSRSQVVVHGRPIGTVPARDYYALKPELWGSVTASLDRLQRRYDIVVMEGAGSPAEINLKHGDIVNMRVALHARSPVLLVGDIDKGGVFASLLGTLMLLEPQERDLVRGLIVNKFRGDLSLLQPGLRMLEERAGVPVAGVVPYLANMRIAEEDAVTLERPESQPAATSLLDIAVIRLQRISNFDDFDPLAHEAGVGVRYVADASDLGEPDLIILPGTKATIADLAFLRESGLAQRIATLAQKGVAAIGICGGYQMLGNVIEDPFGVESPQRTVQGLGLLPVHTVFGRDKATHQVTGRVARAEGLLAHAPGDTFTGYEIHMGVTTLERGTPVLALNRRSQGEQPHPDGALNKAGTVFGCYVHGLFHNTHLRRAILGWLAARKGVSLPASPERSLDQEYDTLAEAVRRSLDMALVYRMTGLEMPK